MVDTTKIKVPAKWAAKLFSKANVLCYQLSGGKVWGTMGGTPVCLVTMTGRKSGRKITIPLMYNPSGENVVLVASFGGAPKNPVWYYNVTTNPDVVVQVGRNKRKMRAKQAKREEKTVLWPAIVANFPAYEVYQTRTERDIPVIVCTPV